MEPNTMDCDIPTALRFCASAAKTADAHWMRAAADEVDRLRSENDRLRGLCGLAPNQPVPDPAG
jgi:hypothetical protein